MRSSGSRVLRTALLASLIVLSGLITTIHAGEIADRAIAAVKALQAEGNISSNQVLRLVVKKGNISNFTGNSFRLKQQWEKATGVILDIKVMPQKASLEMIRSSSDVDLTVARNREFADLYHEGLIVNLEPLLSKYGFSLNGNSKSGFISPEKSGVLWERGYRHTGR